MPGMRMRTLNRLRSNRGARSQGNLGTSRSTRLRESSQMAPNRRRFGALRADELAFADSKLNWYNWNVMTAEQFRATLHQQPFRPFTIRMADGRAFEVGHRDFVALSQSGRTVIVFQPDES